MGASYAEGLTRQGHQVFGYDYHSNIMEHAMRLGIISKESDLKKIGDADLVILALYPNDNVKFVKLYQNFFKKGQMVTDLSGTKAIMMHEIECALPKGVSYTSHHPMAGKEKNGFESRDHHMFKDANFLIVTGRRSTLGDQDTLRKIAKELKFGKISVVDAHMHDALVAYTSQLTHVLAVSLVQSDHMALTKIATGDSFRDLTRIAKINEDMWSELFLENKEQLIIKINDFMKELKHIKELILFEDQDSLKSYLKEAKEKRKSFDSD